MIEVSFWGFLVAAGIPTAVTGFLIWWFQYRIQKRDKVRDERDLAKEQAREEFEMYLVRATSSNIALSVATAKAVQRIPDAHCNGDMTAALNYVNESRHAYKDFLVKQGIHAIYED